MTPGNNEIRATATHNPKHFRYFNNGITLVADDATRSPVGAASRSAGVFTFKGASIVNGAQPVSSLAKVDKDESLGRLRVPIRVILLKTAPPGFGGSVTRTNNFQNRIEPRDFVAQDPEQRWLRQEMTIERIDYQFIRSDDTNPTLTSCELVDLEATCEEVYVKMIATIQSRFAGKFLAVLFKNLTMSKAVFESSV